jgi:hypothetical protein
MISERHTRVVAAGEAMHAMRGATLEVVPGSGRALTADAGPDAAVRRWQATFH